MYKFKMAEQPPLLEGHLKMGGCGIEANSRYLKRNGKPFIPVMGEMHFSRVSDDEWEKELTKMKSGGITIVSTYIIWIHHEEEEGVISFSGGLDLRRFVQLCKKTGLDVILRLGPWVHGECRNGGFPDWLMKKPFALRENNEGYLALVRSFYTAIYRQIYDLFIKDGGPIIGIQLENEYVSSSDHLLTLKQIAKDIGFDVPLYTVTGWSPSPEGADIPEDEVIPVFGGYPEAPWEGHTRRLAPSIHLFFSSVRNDSAIGADLIEEKNAGELKYERYPFITCELGGGNQITHKRRPIIRPMDVYAISLVKLGNGNNLPGYYMYHGGTNPLGKYSAFNESRESGYPNDYSILSYDFQAPIGEYGTIREHYRLLRMLHMFVADFGEMLAPMCAYMSKNQVELNDKESLRYSVRTDGRSGFVFVNHYQRLDTLAEIKNVQFETCGKVFPEKGITVSGENAFILPFGIDFGGVILGYATCQLLCRLDNTYFFTELDGIAPEYLFEDGSRFTPQAGFDSAFEIGGAKFITLMKKQAMYMQKHDGKVYIADECDIYFSDGTPTSDRSEYTYSIYDGNEFKSFRGNNGSQKEQAKVEYRKLDEPSFESRYFYELDMIKPRKKLFYELKVTGDGGFVCIDYVGDAAQLYADGELVADEYYCGKEWLVPSKLLCGKNVTLGISELDRESVYLEDERTETLVLNGIRTSK